MKQANRLAPATRQSRRPMLEKGCHHGQKEEIQTGSSARQALNHYAGANVSRHDDAYPGGLPKRQSRRPGQCRRKSQTGADLAGNRPADVGAFVSAARRGTPVDQRPCEASAGRQWPARSGPPRIHASRSRPTPATAISAHRCNATTRRGRTRRGTAFTVARRTAGIIRSQPWLSRNKILPGRPRRTTP